MAKGGDFMAPKAIATRMKAKGLQKLRWFCQVCQKQCRDENGFKCHATSESHQRQMLIVANDPDKFISEYSEDFEAAFLENLRRRHGTKRLRAAHVYNEYIADKLHVHMNATQWTTLGSFVQYLGRTGKCIVDETEKGWYIQYIDRDPRALARQEELQKKRKSDLDHEERNRLFLARQLQIAQDAATTDSSVVAHAPTKLQRTDASDKIRMGFRATTTTTSDAHSTHNKKRAFNAFDTAADAVQAPTHDHTTAQQQQQKTKRHAVDAIMAEEEQRRYKRQLVSKQEPRKPVKRYDHWLLKGLVVKVVNETLGDGAFFKQKGVVTAVHDLYGATIALMDDSGVVLQLDQDDLETVIPRVGRIVQIVNGDGRGCVAELLAINVDAFHATVRIVSGTRSGDVLERVEYEDICKRADD